VKIDEQVEPFVRRVLGAAVRRDPEQFEAALGAFPDDETRGRGLGLAIAVAAFVMFDTYGGVPSPEYVRGLAETVATAETWATLTTDEVGAYLSAVLNRTPLDAALDPPTAVRLTFIITASLLASSRRAEEYGWWFNYLDRVEAAIEAADSTKS
jgi:hypothetical protein